MYFSLSYKQCSFVLHIYFTFACLVSISPLYFYILVICLCKILTVSVLRFTCHRYLHLVRVLRQKGERGSYRHEELHRITGDSPPLSRHFPRKGIGSQSDLWVADLTIHVETLQQRIQQRMGQQTRELEKFEVERRMD